MGSLQDESAAGRRFTKISARLTRSRLQCTRAPYGCLHLSYNGILHTKKFYPCRWADNLRARIFDHDGNEEQ